MANTKSAKKRAAKSEILKEKNRGYRSRMRTAVKKVRKAVESGDLATATQLLPETLRLIDSTAQKGIVHKNAAARTKSRLVKATRSS